MYSVHAYYLAFITERFLCTWFYPVVVTLTSFYFFEFEADTVPDMLLYMASLAASSYSGMIYGFMIGCFLHWQDMAYLFLWLSIMIFNFGAGFFANTGSGANWFVTGLSYFSPFRYSAEIQLRRVTQGRPFQEQILEHFGYTYGLIDCFIFMAGFCVLCFFAGWIILYLKNRNV